MHSQEKSPPKPRPIKETERHRCVKMPMSKLRKVCERKKVKIPLLSPVFPIPVVCVFVRVFPFRQFINIFADQGVSPSNKKRKLIGSSVQGQRVHVQVLVPALEAAPWVWVSDGQFSSTKVERSAVVRVVCH